MLLTIRSAPPMLRVKSNTCYEICPTPNGHHVHLQIGKVSIAFDGRNHCQTDSLQSYSGNTLEFSEYTDCPVRLDNIDYPKCDNVAETIMFALAADLGYTVSK